MPSHKKWKAWFLAFQPMKVAKNFNISRFTLFSTDGKDKFTLSIDSRWMMVNIEVICCLNICVTLGIGCIFPKNY